MERVSGETVAKLQSVLSFLHSVTLLGDSEQDKPGPRSCHAPRGRSTVHR